MIVVKELEAELPDGTVTWNSIISYPNFRGGHEQSATVKISQENRVTQSNKRKLHKKVKTSSTQTDPQVAVSRPGMHYMETSPGNELFDSFSSLSSVNCTMEQLSLPRPQQRDELATDFISSLTMETATKHLTGKHGDRKRHKNKKEKVKKEMTPNTTQASLKLLKDNTISSPASTTANSRHCNCSPTIISRPRSSLTTSTPSSDTMTHHTQEQPYHSDIMTHHTQQLPHCSDTMLHHTQELPYHSDTVTHHTQDQPYHSDTMTHHIQEQPHCSDTVTHHTQDQPHCSDTVTHLTQKQPQSSDKVTYHSQEQSRIIQQVKHWSKFEQLKAKYLAQPPHTSVTSDNHKTFCSRFLEKQKLN